jgi:predicted Zn-dependent protease with MMP-like domain
MQLSHAPKISQVTGIALAMQSMNHHQFEAVVRHSLGDLPDWVKSALNNIAVVVQDYPDPDIVPDPEGLLGFYTGVPLSERSSEYLGDLPDVIYIFRKPHLELGLPHNELRAEIRRTLLHEIAHYFGIDDSHLEKIGWG